MDAHFEVTKRRKRAGYKFSMDDFGAGLSPDDIKLDRSTVLQAMSSRVFRLVLEDLTCGLGEIAQDGMIAEGIGTEERLYLSQ